MVVVAQSLREQVAWACRILALEGYADLTLGHVSARGPDGEIYIKRKGVALDEVEAEEVAYVVSGSGELRLDDEAVPFGPDEALHIPAGTWHAVANTGSEDVVMVFGFPHPDYPPTERR